MSHTNPALAAACAQLAQIGPRMAAQRAAADSVLARRIIAANPRENLHYGTAGGLQVFAAAHNPATSDLKRRAAEAILAHRRMRAAGGDSDHWLAEAAFFRAAAMIRSRRAPRPLQMAAE